MNLADCLSVQRIFTLRARRKESALRELVRATCGTLPGLEPATVEKAVWERERQVSSWIASGLAIPHGRLAGLGAFHVAVGRSRPGIDFGSPDGVLVHLLVLILGDAREPARHIALLAEVARALRDEGTREAVLRAGSRREARRIILGEGGRRRPAEGAQPLEVSRSLLSHALAVAREVGARAMLLHLDALGGIEPLESLDSPLPLILVTQDVDLRGPLPGLPYRVLQVPFPSLSRSNQVTLSLLLALSQGLIGPQDRVVGLFGRPEPGVVDSLVVIDVARELPLLLPADSAGLLGDVQPAVLERVLRVATELAVEGREGRPTGTLFVLGDYPEVRGLSHQLVINPFRGYRDEEKSVLDPGLEETVKEFAALDGAFLVRGDGVIEAAGAYLRFDRALAELPPGLGARHSAAANITAHTAALSVAVSQSTGRVSLYRAGKLLAAFERPRA
jgi:diadenylate cyclase